MGIHFTAEQRKVIDGRKKNILVSAAAGSGKTAVLVERIIEIICDEKNPVDIDRLLIVTFTNAAAAEMRERISNAIAKKLMVDSENEHLQRQTTLIHNALITTIDSFCLFLIRNSFNEIGLDPSFRVADEGEIKLLKQDIINELFEQYYESNEKKERFALLVETLSGGKREDRLEQIILDIHNFSMSFPWPIEWLLERKKDYEVKDREDFLSKEWVQEWFALLNRNIIDQIEGLKQILLLCQGNGGPYMYEDAILKDIEFLELVLKKESYDERFQLLQGIEFARLSTKKDDSVSEELKELVKQMRNDAKEALKKLQKQGFFMEIPQIIEQMQEMDSIQKNLIDTVILFSEMFLEAKRERNILDFSDMEHYALEILLPLKNGERKPSAVALDYRTYFYEIMIDEYQDSNFVQEYILKSISKEEDGGFNRFMVGDVKQSIYKFRLARPEIFLEKFSTYQVNGISCERIDLHKNFRSRVEVIDSVNFIFEQIMRSDLGKIEYDSSAALYLGAQYEEFSQNQTMEVLTYEVEEGEEEKEWEARMVATKIREMVGTFQVTDKITNEKRPAMYKDIVILFRSNAKWDDIFKEVLEEYSIPTHITSKTGYFLTNEVQLVLNFLRVIDNPRQDIPLFGLMKSFIGMFSDDEIGRIRGEETGKLYDCLLGCKSEKVVQFLNFIDSFRKKIPILSIHELLLEFMHETEYLHYIRALPGGEQRVANVKILIGKAQAFCATSYFGLYHFLRYIEQIKEYDMGEANILDEKADVVRIMSIHKSKGLEFPICFLSGASKKFNQMDTNQSLVCDMDLGIAMEYKNAIKRIKGKDVRKFYLSQKMKLENLGEELRILYVALTRAKEKMIVTSTSKDIKKQMLSKLAITYFCEKTLPIAILTNCNSYFDLFLVSLMRHKALIEWRNNEGIFCDSNEVRQLNNDTISFEVYTKPKILIETLKKEQAINQKVDEFYEQMEQYSEKKSIIKREQFEFHYPFEHLKNLYAKTSVSEQKMAAIHKSFGEEVIPNLFETKEIEPYIPKFIEDKEKITGAMRGNAYHKIMELLDFSIGNHDSYQKHLEKIIEEGRIRKEDADLIVHDKIQTFLKSYLSQRMQKSDLMGQLYREQPFVIGIPANKLQKKIECDEIVLMQGIIDAYFVEDEELVLVDYKTDVIKTKNELIDRYKVQLEYYANALEKLTNKKVKECILYSFYLEETISLDKECILS
ncbi:MAG: helicase-exonuclease AddAB subunit AddA [Lachnospiraceae bacterium]